MQQESYEAYMRRRTREEDAKMAINNAKQNAQRSIWVTFS